MGIIKDVYKETEGFTSLARLQHFLSLRSWKGLIGSANSGLTAVGQMKISGLEASTS